MKLKFSFFTFALFTGVHGNSKLRGRQLSVDTYNYDQTISWYEKQGKELGYEPQCTGSVCGMWGDPHITTCDELHGSHFGCQAEGTVTLMKNSLYNIEGNFIAIGEDAMNSLKFKRVGRGDDHIDIHNAGATVTNDIAIEITTDSTTNSKRIIQLGFGNLNDPIIDELTGKPMYPSEKNCHVRKFYNNHMIAAKTDLWMSQCRRECLKTNGCEYFNSWPDKKCELFTEAADLLDSDPAYGRVVSGTTDCGKASKGVTKENQPAMDDESDKKKMLVGGWKRCPLLLHVDKELVDISTKDAVGGYLFNDDGISVQMKDRKHPNKNFGGSETIQILHQLEDGPTTEMILTIKGSGPAEMWTCHFEFDICLPEEAKDKFMGSTVGLLGTPDGDLSNDKTDRVGNTFDFDRLFNEVRNRVAYKDAPDSCTWDIAMLEYCHDTWCVSADETIMVAAPGQNVNDILCQAVEPVCPDSYCIMSVDQLNTACKEYTGEGYTAEDLATCKLECCHGSDECEDAKDHLVVYADSEPEDAIEFIIDPPCDDRVFKKTNTTACPGTPLVKVLHGPILPETQEILYDINPSAGNDGLRSVTFRVNNPFDSAADIYVSHNERIGLNFPKPTCDGMLEVNSGCDIDANTIEVRCVSFPDQTSFAIADVYFVSQGAEFERVDSGAEVKKCCVDEGKRDEYNDPAYHVVHYAFEFQCSCPHSDGDNVLEGQ